MPTIWTTRIAVRILFRLSSTTSSTGTSRTRTSAAPDPPTSPVILARGRSGGPFPLHGTRRVRPREPTHRRLTTSADNPEKRHRASAIRRGAAQHDFGSGRRHRAIAFEGWRTGAALIAGIRCPSRRAVAYLAWSPLRVRVWRG